MRLQTDILNWASFTAYEQCFSYMEHVILVEIFDEVLRLGNVNLFTKFYMQKCNFHVPNYQSKIK